MTNNGMPLVVWLVGHFVVDKWDAVGGVVGEVDVCLVGGQLGGVADSVVEEVLGACWWCSVG